MEELKKRMDEIERRVKHLEAVLQYQARKNKWVLLPSMKSQDNKIEFSLKGYDGLLDWWDTKHI